ncbi:MAG: endonuclease/exonuclease/phosphatase family protein [Bdellovibrionales bacterium]|nr:endonuclease/exonuclease/phosphatase family protein [Bdellovibrionales bacterium]
MEAAAVLTLLTLNLHGYHPMNGVPRFFEDPEGRLSAADTSPFHFTWEELSRGNQKRLDALARYVSELKPDVLALQEVGAGTPWGGRDCSVFHERGSAEHDGENSARRLERRLGGLGYQLWTACRGNLGWVTDAETFKERRMVRVRKGVREVVWDFGRNPYPNGILIEGMALLVRRPWRVEAHEEWNGRVNAEGHRSFAQIVELVHSTGRRVRLANVHAGHKVQHFEQATALRERLSIGPAVDGVVVAGDFNARPYRPAGARVEEDLEAAAVPRGELSMVPWQARVKGQYSFDLTGDPAAGRQLAHGLMRLNADAQYKPWAMITDESEAGRRVRGAVAWLTDLRREGRAPSFAEAVERASETGACPAEGTRQTRIQEVPTVDWTCRHPDRIDHVFFPPAWKVLEAWVGRPRDDHDPLPGWSDHPLVFAELLVQ